MRRASWMSFGMMVTRLAWMAHKLVSSKRPTRYASDASWSASTAVDWKRKSVLKSCAISRTRRWNGSLRIKSSVDFWYLLRSDRRVTDVPEVSQRSLSSVVLNLAPSLFTQTTRIRGNPTTTHVPNLTKRDGTRAVAVRLLNACDSKRNVGQFSAHSLASSSLALARRARRSNPPAVRDAACRHVNSRARAASPSREFHPSLGRVPPVVGADLRAALVASCFLGALPPVDLRAVCFVRAVPRLA